ncbi:hypothetical protein [Ekhidna sp.]
MKIYISILSVVLSLTAYAQSSILINQSRWNDPVAWQNSSTPTIKAFGEHSDSLKSIYKTEFLFHNNRYYHVTSWADYYLWFTQKYSYMFNLNAELYKYYHQAGDNFAMMDFVFNFHRGGILPTIRVDLGNGESLDVRSYAFDTNRFNRESNKYRRRQNLKHIANGPSVHVKPTFIGSSGQIGSSTGVNTQDRSAVIGSNGQNANSAHISRPKDQ